MKFSTVLTGAFLAGAAAAAPVDCLVNGVAVATVDSETGVCPFTVPDEYPVNFEFTSLEDYDVTFYYAQPDQTKYFTDIVDAGRTIEIPASVLVDAPPVGLYQVHLEETPASNSTAAIRRRLLRGSSVVARDELDQFLAMAKNVDGTALPGSAVEFAVAPADEASSTSEVVTAPMSSEPVATETSTETTIITITSCSDNKCDETTVPATPSESTTTVSGIESITTTYCPVTTVVTITSCSDNKCDETTVPATPSLTTETKEGEVTSYYTYCPLTGEDTTTTTVETSVVTITSCSDNKCDETTVPATPCDVTTTNEAGETSTYSTWTPVSPTGEETTPAAAPSTVAAESTTLTSAAASGSSPSGSPISTYEASGNKAVSSFVALIAIPFAGLFL